MFMRSSIGSAERRPRCAPVSSSAIASSPACRRLVSTVLSVSHSLRTDITDPSLDLYTQS